jgi:hypothetical protein
MEGGEGGEVEVREREGIWRGNDSGCYYCYCDRDEDDNMHSMESKEHLEVELT